MCWVYPDKLCSVSGVQIPERTSPVEFEWKRCGWIRMPFLQLAFHIIPFLGYVTPMDVEFCYRLIPMHVKTSPP